jgi:tetratricopeptide (TPR) repeat protein
VALCGIAAAGAFWISSRRGEQHLAVPAAFELPDAGPEAVEVVRQMRVAVDAEPSNAERWGRLGMACEANNFLGLARDAYSRALSLGGGNARWHYRLAIVASRLGESAEAIEQVDRAIALEPRFAALHWRKGLWLLDVGRVVDAEASFRKAVEIDPGDRAGKLGLARALLQRRLPDQAATILQNELSARPDDSYTRYLLGTAYREMGRSQDAAAAFAAGAPTAPVWSDRWSEELTEFQRGYTAPYREATAHLARGDREKAVELFGRLRRDYPDDVSVANQLAVTYISQGRTDSAIDVLNDAAARKPEFFETYVNLASAFLSRGDAARGLEYASRGVALNARSPLAQTVLGVALWRSGRRHEALAALQLSLQFNPKNVDAHVWSGMILNELGQPAGALVEFEMAAKLSPHVIETWLGIASVHMQRGNLDAAAAALHRAAEIDPHHPQVAAGRAEELARRAGRARSERQR